MWENSIKIFVWLNSLVTDQIVSTLGRQLGLALIVSGHAWLETKNKNRDSSCIYIHDAYIYTADATEWRWSILQLSFTIIIVSNFRGSS